MKAFYDKETKQLEIYDSKYDFTGEVIDEDLTLFLSDNNGSTVGLSLAGAPKNIKKLALLPSSFRLAGLIFLIRKLENLSQEEMEKTTQLGRGTIQSLESGETNISYDNLLKNVNRFPQYDYSVLLRPHPKFKSTS